MFTLVLFVCLLQVINTRNIDTYSLRRSLLLQTELDTQVGSDLPLNTEEVVANEILMELKRREIDESFRSNEFSYSKHYFDYRDEIKRSKVYDIIRAMPKGGALHVHSSLMLSADRLVALTYEDHLYACFAADDLQLQFSYDVPLRPCERKWRLLDDVRRASGNVTRFDSDLQKYFTLNVDENTDYDINFIWERFEKVTTTISSLINYRPAREKFFYEGLTQFYNDNVMYVEIRSGLSYLYELNGTVHDRVYLAHLYHRVAEQFKEDHPDFMGVKLIVSKRRSITIEEAKGVIDLAKRLRIELPQFLAGFDLVGQEDLGKPLKDFQPLLDEVKEDIDFYFHGGETNWHGTASDENLIDAILLGSKRIGHGFALIKHPTLMKTVRENDIAIEVNVISNLVLSLLCDIRNHPLATYLALGMPVVLSSDDPGVWGADPLSYDYYLTFVAVASRHADLRMLKQLVLNSVKYSALDDTQKKIMYKQLQIKWDEFIRDVIKRHN
ncbi:adenosine deaminase 2-like [Aricia agestis]|uniref:adenosine deaminase 2-like n=1 Tax=Aricia agestis TaxID=91739 RepID=UPI001C20243C|nr:adenosine deaminase 2-like [Aricia agestis]